MTEPVTQRPRSTWSVGELRHGILNLADAFAQSLALLSLALGYIERDGVGNEPVELDLVERVAACDLVRGRVHVRADVVEQVVVGHRISVLLHLRDRLEGRRRQTREDRHPVVVVVREIHDPHRSDYLPSSSSVRRPFRS